MFGGRIWHNTKNVCILHDIGCIERTYCKCVNTMRWYDLQVFLHRNSGLTRGEQVNEHTTATGPAAVQAGRKCPPRQPGRCDIQCWHCGNSESIEIAGNDCHFQSRNDIWRIPGELQSKNVKKYGMFSFPVMFVQVFAIFWHLFLQWNFPIFASG